MALSSALLLIASFPNFNQPWCVWVAFLPWLALLGRCSARAAFWWSYAIGLTFFLASMWWLIHVTVVGWLILCATLACFFGVFGWVTHHSQLPVVSVPHLLLLPAVWVSMEFLRSHLFTGLGWNLLAYSQTPWLELIQVSEVTGAWGVSFIIVLVNVGLASALVQALTAKRSVRYLALAAACLLVVVGYGAWRIPRVGTGPVARLALVQGNVPQEEKWDPAYAESIMQRYETLTREAAGRDVQLIIWPETSTPGYFGINEKMTSRIAALARSVKTPLLVGGPMGRLVDGRQRLTNSAALLDAEGTLRQRYDKLHLVPFGEFVPFERFIPWLRGILPPIGDFIPGTASTVFSLPAPSADARPGGEQSPLDFSVLICFEDVFPHLARQFVQEGARVLLNITNDAWFGPTAAAYQHAQASTFRAVELRVPVVRAANTGWSGCIDHVGRWRGSVQDDEGRELFIQGTTVCEVPSGATQSLYSRWSDWFAGLCLVWMMSWLLAQRFLGRDPSAS